MDDVESILSQAGVGRNMIQVAREPSRVVEVLATSGYAVFDLNDIVGISDGGKNTIVYLRHCHSAGPLRIQMPYEKFKELIGANPVRLEDTDEDR